MYRTNIKWKNKTTEDGKPVDYTGREIKVGDYLAHAVTRSRSAALDLSMVVEINDGDVLIQKLIPMNQWKVNSAIAKGEEPPKLRFWKGKLNYPTRNSIIVTDLIDTDGFYGV